MKIVFPLVTGLYVVAHPLVFSEKKPRSNACGMAHSCVAVRDALWLFIACLGISKCAAAIGKLSINEAFCSCSTNHSAPFRCVALQVVAASTDAQHPEDWVELFTHEEVIKDWLAGRIDA